MSVLSEFGTNIIGSGVCICEKYILEHALTICV